MNFDDLTPEQKEKALTCKTPEELLALASEAGYELSEEELKGIAGGNWGNPCGPKDSCNNLCVGDYYPR